MEGSKRDGQLGQGPLLLAGQVEMLRNRPFARLLRTLLSMHPLALKVVWKSVGTVHRSNRILICSYCHTLTLTVWGHVINTSDYLFL